MENSKISVTQTWLTVLYVSALLMSNIVAAKQVLLPFGITMTGAVIIFPVTYILSDVFSEVYGYKWSRITCYMAFLMNLLMCILFSIAISTKAPSYWNNQEAFVTVLSNSPRMLAASLAGFFFGDWLNDKVFKKLKENHAASLKGYGVRSILSSIVGESVDSAIFIPIAFLGQMPFKNMIIMGITQVFLKVLYELIILPLSTYICKLLITKEQKK